MSYYDYDASKINLIERVRLIHASESEGGRYRTEEKKALDDLAEKLTSVAEKMSDPIYEELEAIIDEDVTEIDNIGVQTVIEEQQGRYQNTQAQLRVIADTATDLAAKIDDSRKRYAFRFAARALLHLLYQCGHKRPTIYDDSFEVNELSGICCAAGLPRSPEACRTTLSEALKDFDPFFDEGIREIFVIKQ